MTKPKNIHLIFPNKKTTKINTIPNSIKFLCKKTQKLANKTLL